MIIPEGSNKLGVRRYSGVTSLILESGQAIEPLDLVSVVFIFMTYVISFSWHSISFGINLLC